MTLRQKISISLICLALLLVQAGCGPASPTATPTSTEAPTEMSTSTLQPTEEQPATPTPAPADTNLTPVGSNTTPGSADQNGTAAATAPVTGPSSGGAAADKYQYLGQDIADHTQFLPNRPVTVTWTIKNIGTVGWTKAYNLRYFSGPKASKDVYPFSKDVPVQGTINFTVTFTTPADPGDYDLWFKLTNSQGQNFGDLDLVYTVSNHPQKITSTSTPAK